MTKYEVRPCQPLTYALVSLTYVQELFWRTRASSRPSLKQPEIRLRCWSSTMLAKLSTIRSS